MCGFENKIPCFQATAISLGIHVNLVGRLFACLRALEAAAGEKLSHSLQVKNAVEVGATSVRTARIGKNSQTYKDQIGLWKRKHPHAADPPQYLVHFRVLDACERGSGRMVIAPASLKVLPATAKPPQESIFEIVSSQILTRIQSGSVCYAFGCRAWQGAAKQQVPGKRLKFEQVKHNRGEFVKRLGRKPRPCASSLADTQGLDRRWDWLKKPLPRQLHTHKDARKDFQGLWQYLWFAVWRKQAGAQVLEKLGQLARNVQKLAKLCL